MAHIKISHLSMTWGLSFLRSKVPCLELFRYLQAVVFVLICVNLVCFFLVFSISVMYLAIFWQRPFFALFSSRLLFAFLSRLFTSYCCSAVLQCFHGVQIIMSANISQMINKNQFFHYDQNIVISVNYWISVHPCWLFDVLLIATFIILCCFSRNINFFFGCFPTFSVIMSNLIKSYVFCSNKRKLVLNYRKYIF